MKLFHYKAYDKAGAKVEGILDAPDKASLLKTLKSQGLLVSQVVEKKGASSLSLSLSNKVSLADSEFLTAELSLLLQSGVRNRQRHRHYSSHQIEPFTGKVAQRP